MKRDTWWGYALHVVRDNVRFPYTAFGMRVDLNHGKWHGPNNGNFPYGNEEPVDRFAKWGAISGPPIR